MSRQQAPGLPPGAAVVTGVVARTASSWRAEHREVHALVRRAASVQDLQRGADHAGRFVVHEQDLLDTDGLVAASG